jgi:hypothetical protein
VHALLTRRADGRLRLGVRLSSTALERSTDMEWTVFDPLGNPSESVSRPVRRLILKEPTGETDQRCLERRLTGLGRGEEGYGLRFDSTPRPWWHTDAPLDLRPPK